MKIFIAALFSLTFSLAAMAEPSEIRSAVVACTFTPAFESPKTILIPVFPQNVTLGEPGGLTLEMQMVRPRAMRMVLYNGTEILGVRSGDPTQLQSLWEFTSDGQPIRATCTPVSESAGRSSN